MDSAGDKNNVNSFIMKKRKVNAHLLLLAKMAHSVLISQEVFANIFIKMWEFKLTKETAHIITEVTLKS